jgi:alpha-N-acetylglucosamine transferase
MTRGAIIFAHNSRDIDYALLAVISGGLAKKHLNIPVSLITDASTIEWMQTSKTYERAVEVFDKIITVEKPKTTNSRRLHDGRANKIIPFVNTNRNSVWELTPYDRTLLLDSDYLIFSNKLDEYWNLDEDILIANSANDIYDQKRLGYHDKYVSDTGVHLFWATTVMFTKNDRSRSLFDMIEYVKNNYEYYADIFRFDSRQYRNDIAFSVAKHILDGFETSTAMSLPPLLTTMDKDILHSVDSQGKLTFLIAYNMDSNYSAAAITGMDLHIMNKQSIIRNAEALLSLI